MSTISLEEFFKLRKALVESNVLFSGGDVDLSGACVDVGFSSGLGNDTIIQEQLEYIKRNVLADRLVKDQLSFAGITVQKGR